MKNLPFKVKKLMCLKSINVPLISIAYFSKNKLFTMKINEIKTVVHNK
jgi:hypothetical protein